MADIQAFRGIRYDLGHVGSLADVVAPPYDVIKGDLQDELYQRHAANVVRLILNREEPNDEPDEKYERASRTLRSWQRQGVLSTETQPSIYAYQQEFTFAGQSFTRRGFMARLRLERFGEGQVYPHEETHSAAKVDRLKLTHACKANLSPIFGIYPDEQNVAQDCLESVTLEALPLEASDDSGVIHRLWPVSNAAVIAELNSLMSPKPIYIADGHHRYETACNYRDSLAEGGALPANHPANYVMMMFVSMHDPGMIVLPTHRLFRGIPEISAEELATQLGDCFTTQLIGSGADKGSNLWAEIEAEGNQSVIGIHTAKDDQWSRVEPNENGRKRMADISSGQSEDWQSLGVSLLHKLLIQDCLGLKDLPSPKYVHEIDEVIDGVEHGDSVGRDATGQLGSGERFNLSALVMPATLEHVRSISEHQERMPAKSTYFYPKLLSGLVINPLD